MERRLCHSISSWGGRAHIVSPPKNSVICNDCRERGLNLSCFFVPRSLPPYGLCPPCCWLLNSLFPSKLAFFQTHTSTFSISKHVTEVVLKCPVLEAALPPVIVHNCLLFGAILANYQLPTIAAFWRQLCHQELSVIAAF